MQPKSGGVGEFTLTPNQRIGLFAAHNATLIRCGGSSPTAASVADWPLTKTVLLRVIHRLAIDKILWFGIFILALECVTAVAIRRAETLGLFILFKN